MEWFELLTLMLLAGGSLLTVLGSVRKFIVERWRRLFAGKSRKSVILSNGVLGLVSLMLLIWLAPVTANAWLFQGILLHLPHVSVLVISIAIFVYVWRHRDGTLTKRRVKDMVGETLKDGDTLDIGALHENLKEFSSVTGSRTVNWLVGIVVVNIVWLIMVGNFIDWGTYHLYAKSKERSALIIPLTEGLRYTPREVAHTELDNSISSATEDTDLPYTRPIFTKGQFGFITPILPDGVPSVFTKTNPGFLYYDDSRAREADGSGSMLDRYDQPFICGEGRAWFYNLNRQAYLEDFLSVYEKAHYIDVSKEGEPMRFVAVLPKIKYRFFLFPRWDGSVIIDQDCNIEDLSIEELVEHPVYSKQWVAPIELARHYTEIQNFAAGLMAGSFNWWRVDGKLEIPTLPGINQFPHVQVNQSGEIDFFVATEAEGGGSAMYRAYYFDGTTFKMSHFEFPQTEKGKVYGPAAALERIPNLPDYNWHRIADNGVESGNHIPIEPVFIPREDGSTFWKFIVTNMDKAGVSGAAVSNAFNTRKIFSFTDGEREYYESWLRGGEVSREQMLRDAIKAAGDAMEKAQSELKRMGKFL